MDTSTIVKKCQTLGLVLSAEEPKVYAASEDARSALERLLALSCNMKLATSSLGGSSPTGSGSPQHEPRQTQEEIVSAICEVETAVGKLLESLARTQKLSSDLIPVTEQLAARLGKAEQQLLEYRFLAEYRDYISSFRFHVVQKMGEKFDIVSWEHLTHALKAEERMEESAHEVTPEVVNVLTSMKFSWEEWQLMRDVADAGIDTALRNLDTELIPPHLENTKKVLKKVLTYVKNTAPVRVARRREVCCRARMSTAPP